MLRKKMIILGGKINMLGGKANLLGVKSTPGLCPVMHGIQK